MAFVTFLDAMLHPHQHSQLGTNDTWDWDRDTLVKAWARNDGCINNISKHRSIYHYQEPHFGHSKGSFSQIAEAQNQDVLEAYA